MHFIAFIIFGICLLFVIYFQRKLYLLLKKEDILFLRYLTDGYVDKGRRGDPSKWLKYIFSYRSTDSKNVFRLKKQLKISIIATLISFVFIPIMILLTASSGL